MRIIEIHVNCPDADTAAEIARTIVGNRLAACANITPNVMSTYWWQGVLETEPEVTLVLKTRPDLFDAVAAKVSSLHPYDLPSILGHEVDASNPAYTDWVHAQTIDAP